MSHLVVLVRPELATGFQLAGVETHPARDIETAEALLKSWLNQEQAGLLAIDAGLLNHLNAGLLRRLENSARLRHIPIPGGQDLGRDIARRHRIAELLHRAVGFHIAFAGEKAEADNE